MEEGRAGRREVVSGYTADQPHRHTARPHARVAHARNTNCTHHPHEPEGATDFLACRHHLLQPSVSLGTLTANRARSGVRRDRRDQTHVAGANFLIQGLSIGDHLLELMHCMQELAGARQNGKEGRKEAAGTRHRRGQANAQHKRTHACI